MKPTFILSATLALAAAATTQAQTVIDIVGSSAGRSAVHSAILDALAGETYAFTGDPSAAKAKSAIYKGQLGTGGPNVIIRTFWAGSVNGVQDVGEQIAQTKLLSTNEADVPTSSAPVENTSPIYASSSDANSKPEIGFSDVFAASTGFSVPVETQVAVIPFKWYKNLNADANLTNMTPLFFQQMYGSLGSLPLSMFTGLAADKAKYVYGCGRDNDSGTRITTLAETGFGVFNSVKQYAPTYDAATSTVTALGSRSNSGFGSGSDMKKVMLCNYSGGSLIGYIGASDWLGDTYASQELTWNGAPYSEANLISGKYTFWGYLHMNSIELSGTTSTFFDTIKTKIETNPGSGLLSITLMEVARDGDGAPVYPTY